MAHVQDQVATLGWSCVQRFIFFTTPCLAGLVYLSSIGVSVYFGSYRYTSRSERPTITIQPVYILGSKSSIRRDAIQEQQCLGPVFTAHSWYYISSFYQPSTKSLNMPKKIAKQERVSDRLPDGSGSGRWTDDSNSQQHPSAWLSLISWKDVFVGINTLLSCNFWPDRTRRRVQDQFTFAGLHTLFAYINHRANQTAQCSPHF